METLEKQLVTAIKQPVKNSSRQSSKPVRETVVLLNEQELKGTTVEKRGIAE